MEGTCPPRLDVLEKHATNGGRGFAGELSPAVGSVPKWSTCFALAGDLTNSEQRTALDEIATLCRWDLAECHLLRVPGVKWPPPAHVPAELAYKPARYSRLRVALSILAGKPEAAGDAGQSGQQNGQRKSVPRKCEVLKRRKIRKELSKGGTKTDIVRDFADGDEEDSSSLGQLNRYPTFRIVGTRPNTGQIPDSLFDGPPFSDNAPR